MEIGDLDSLSLTELLIWRFRVQSLIDERRQQLLNQVCGRFLLSLNEAGIEPREAAAWLARRAVSSAGLGELDNDAAKGEQRIYRNSP